MTCSKVLLSGRSPPKNDALMGTTVGGPMSRALNECPSITCQPTRMSRRAASERRGRADAKRRHSLRDPHADNPQEAYTDHLGDPPRYQGRRAPHHFLQMIIPKHFKTYRKFAKLVRSGIRFTPIHQVLPYASSLCPLSASPHKYTHTLFLNCVRKVTLQYP